MFSLQLIIQNMILVLVAVSYVNGQQRSLYMCDPTMDCQYAAVGDKVPDPYECQNFYLCVYDPTTGGAQASSDPLPCPVGQYFSHQYGECRADDGVPCQDICLNICVDECHAETGEKIFYPGDCQKYYVCNAGDKIEVVCPGGLYFDGKDCIDNINDCCDNCTPYCDSEFKQVRDPNYCQSYYVCTAEGIPGAESHFSCSEGMYFDANLGTCQTYSEGQATCTPLCPLSGRRRF